MTDQEIRDKILQAIYEQYKKKGFHSAKILSYGLAREIGVEESAMDRNVQYLVGKGFVTSGAGGPGSGPPIGITSRGVDVVEGPSKYNPPEDHRKMIIEMKGGNVGQIVQDQHIDINPSIFLEQLNLLIEKYQEVPPDKKKYWLDLLKEIPKEIFREAIRVTIDQIKPR